MEKEVRKERFIRVQREETVMKTFEVGVDCVEKRGAEENRRSFLI